MWLFHEGDEDDGSCGTLQPGDVWTPCETGDSRDASRRWAVSAERSLRRFGFVIVALDSRHPLPPIVARCQHVTESFYDDERTPPAIRRLVRDFATAPRADGIDLGLSERTKRHHAFVKLPSLGLESNLVTELEWASHVQSYAVRIPRRVNLGGGEGAFPWPLLPPDFEDVVRHYMDGMREFALQVCFALWPHVAALRADPSAESYGADAAFLRCIAPPQVLARRDEVPMSKVVEECSRVLDAVARSAAATVRVQAHTDSGVLTILPVNSSDLEGLEIMLDSATQWVAVSGHVQRARDAWRRALCELDQPMSRSLLMVMFAGEEATALGSTATGGSPLHAAVHRVALPSADQVEKFLAAEVAARVTMPFQLRGIATRDGSAGEARPLASAPTSLTCRQLQF